MTIIIAQDCPDAVRGILKRWFIEPKPHVFVGTVNASIREHLLNYLRKNSEGVRLLVIYSAANCQGFIIEQINDPDYSGVTLDGLHLLASPQSLGKVDYPF